MESEPSELTREAERLLDILSGLYGWSTRPTIAAELGKEVLSQHDLTILELLTMRGLIETRKATRNAKKNMVWEYRFVEPEEEDAMPPDTAVNDESEAR